MHVGHISFNVLKWINMSYYKIYLPLIYGTWPVFQSYKSFVRKGIKLKILIEVNFTVNLKNPVPTKRIINRFIHLLDFTGDKMDDMGFKISCY